MDLATYRSSAAEQERVRDLLRLVPSSGFRALDIGTRDGYVATLLAERYSEVVALDLEQPEIDHPRVTAIKGSAADLTFPDRSFDLVLCGGSAGYDRQLPPGPPGSSPDRSGYPGIRIASKIKE